MTQSLYFFYNKLQQNFCRPQMRGRFWCRCSNEIMQERKGNIMGKFVIRTVPSGVKFDLKATNGQVIATSEVYESKAACQNGVESVKKNAVVAGIEDLTVPGCEAVTNPKFELYQDKGGQYRFRLTARNGQIIATSEAYTTKPACENGIQSVKNNAPDAEVVEE